MRPDECFWQNGPRPPAAFTAALAAAVVCGACTRLYISPPACAADRDLVGASSSIWHSASISVSTIPTVPGTAFACGCSGPCSVVALFAESFCCNGVVAKALDALGCVPGLTHSWVAATWLDCSLADDAGREPESAPPAPPNPPKPGNSCCRNCGSGPPAGMPPPPPPPLPPSPSPAAAAAAPLRRRWGRGT